MSEIYPPRPGAPPDRVALEPALVLSFNRNDKSGTERHRIPREGMILGRGALIFGPAFEDLRMSTRHAEVRIVAGRVLIQDLKSGNGTRVNGQPILDERVLVAGDVLRLGDTLLVYSPSAPGAILEACELVGSSAAMTNVRRSINAVAARKHTVVISGETGTGKEVVAQLLHRQSGRTGPFVAVNCGSFIEGLLASDLFGHVRGAFTGAVAEQQGLFRAAHGGSLMLDEVAEIPLALQANLLRVLETHEVRPVGGTRSVVTDVRVIVTSNSDLIDLVQAGTFRPDLYSRLAQWTIRVPPLRERREDIAALTVCLLGRCDGLGRELTPDFAEALLVHDWPLNVRGLLNVLSIAVISSPEAGPLILGPEVTLALLTSRRLAGQGKPIEPTTFGQAELIQLMEQFKGRVAAAARHVGVGRPKLYRMLWAHGVKPETFRVES